MRLTRAAVGAELTAAGEQIAAPQALLAGMLGYGCANTAFAGLAIQLVVRRELGILKRLRATPLSGTTYITATLASTLIVFLLQAIGLFVLGRILYGTPFPHALGSLVLALVIGAAVFAALGVATASLIRSAEGSSAHSPPSRSSRTSAPEGSERC